MKIPVSMLSAYMYCSRKLFLEQVLMIEEPDKESLVMGSIRHEFYDMTNKMEQSIVTSITEKMPAESIQAIYKKEHLAALRKAIVNNKKRLESIHMGMLDAYKKSVPFAVDESLMRAANISNFIEANDLFGRELWEKLTPKIISELKVESEELRLRGIVDQVHVYGNEYVPFELKTGKTPNEGVWPGHRIQIAAYSLLLQEHLGKPIKEGFVFYVETGQKRRISVNPFMKEEIKKTVDEIIALLGKKDIPDFCGNPNKCAKCGIKATCYSEDELASLIKLKV